MTTTETARPKSADLRPGTRLRVKGTTKVEMLGERKKPADYKPDELNAYLPGWWMRSEHGRRGFSDEALDRCLNDGTYEVLNDCDPWKVVGNRGQLQYEWHQDGIDIEVEFTADGKLDGIYVSRPNDA